MSSSRPGFLVVAAFIGPGTLTVATLAGGEAGFSLLWVIPLAVVITIILQEMSARLGLVSGGGLPEAIRIVFAGDKSSWWIGLLMAAVVLISSSLYQAGNITGTALGLSLLTGIDVVWLKLPVAIMAFALIFLDSLSAIEKCLTFIVMLMLAVFALTFVQVFSCEYQVLDLMPQETSENHWLYIVAIIGTTVVPYNLFLHASACAKQSSALPMMQRIRFARYDCLLSIGIGGGITALLLSTAALTLYGHSFVISDIGSMTKQLMPLLGEFSRHLFSIGLFAAGLSSAILAPMAAAFAVCGAMGWSASHRSLPFILINLLASAIGILISTLSVKPLLLIVFVQAANAVLLPFIAAFLLLAMNHKKLMGEFRNSTPYNLLALGAVLASCVLGGIQCIKLWL